MPKLSLIVSLLVCGLALDDELPFLAQGLTGNTDLLVGDDLVLSCNIDESFHPFTASNASFLFQFKGNADHLTCIPESSTSVINQSLAVLTVKNVTFDNVGVYGCYVGNKMCLNGQPSNDLETVELSHDVVLDYFPQNVINFTCLVDNWESMDCTWQHPVVYKQLSSIEVTLNYAICNIRPVQAYKCPVQSYTSCRWTQDDFRSNSCFQMEVVVNNIKHGAAAAAQIFTVIPTTLVKPAPVSELNILTSPTMPGCFVLSWQHQSNNVAFRVRQRNAMNHEFTIVNGNTTLRNLTLCGYPSFTWYNFCVDCYPSYPYSGFWSEPACRDATTPMIAPELGPRMTNGSFTTTECVDGKRTVTLMWQEVEKSAQNGIIDQYLIMMDERVVKNVTSETYSASVELPCDETSLVKIAAHNMGGNSVSPTVVLIPSTRVTVPMKVQESFAVADMSNQTGEGYIYPVQVLWGKQDGGGQGGGSEHTIFWCERRAQDKLCKGQIRWFHAAENQTSYDIPELSLAPTSYIFGISVVQEGLASGIFWTDCLFRNKPFSLQQKGSQQTLAVKSLENEVLVSWSEIKCSYETRTRVTSYRVKWSEVTEGNTSSQISSFDVPGRENMYTVSGLTASVIYKFTVQPMADEDLGGEVMPWKVAVPRRSDNQSWMIPVIIVVAVVIIVLLLVGSYFCRKCRRSRKKVLYMKESAQTLPFEAGPRVAYDTPTLNSSPTASARLLSVPDVDSQLSHYLRLQDLSEVISVPDLQHSQVHEPDADSAGQINGRAHLSNHVNSNSCRSGPANNRLAGQDVFQDNNSQAEDMGVEEYVLIVRGKGGTRGLETSLPECVVKVEAGASSVLGQVDVHMLLGHEDASLVLGKLPLEFCEESGPAARHGSSGNSSTPVNSNGYVLTSPGAGALSEEALSNQDLSNNLKISGTFSSQDIPYSLQVDGASSGRNSPCSPQMCGPFVISFNPTTMQSNGASSDLHDSIALTSGQSSDQQNSTDLQFTSQPLIQHIPTDLQSSSASTSAEKTSSASTSAEKTSSASTSAEKTSSASTSAEKTSSASTSVEKTSSASTSAEKTSSASTSAEKTSSASTSAEKTSSASTSAEHTSSDSTSAEDYTRFCISDHLGITLDSNSSSCQSSL